MRLPRPYIPVSVRLQVAFRQMAEWSPAHASAAMALPYCDSRKLKIILDALFSGSAVQLDHDPALQNRERYADITGIHYEPAANDPAHLIYRRADAHKIKTLVRGDGAQHSDAALARKNKRIARNRNPNRKRFKWPKRKMRSA